VSPSGALALVPLMLHHREDLIVLELLHPVVAELVERQVPHLIMMLNKED
jgi:hypothetical protein